MSMDYIGKPDLSKRFKRRAVEEGKKAVELLPPQKDAINGALLLQYLAVIYANTGQRTLAMHTLQQATRIPSEVSYGNLKLHPFWDPLRGDAEFEGLIASLAPGSR